MQAKPLLLGALAGISISILSLTLVPTIASAKSPVAEPPALAQGGYGTNLIMDNDNVYILQNGAVYKVNKLQMLVMGRALLR